MKCLDLNNHFMKQTATAKAQTSEPTPGRRTVRERASKAEARDHLDDQLDVWTREIMSLDRLTEGIIERIYKLSRYFSHSMDMTLAEVGISHRTFRVLGRLRYQGPPYQLSAGQLAEAMGLSSGAMTNRLDRLEQAGLVRRVPDPDDRRGVLVEPTEEGHAAWNRTTGSASMKEKLIASVLSEQEKEQLHSLLRTLMAAFPAEVKEASMRGKSAKEPEEA
jgi:DNA-binding MarR family transcriptional regulator